MDEVKVDETKTSDAETKETPKTPQRTPQEIAKYNLSKAVEKARAEGIDPNEVLGLKLKIDENLSEDEPLTIGKLKEFQKQEGKKTALNLADDIEDESEREDIKRALEEDIKSSGDAQKDLAKARAIVNVNRTIQVAEEQSRKGIVSRTAGGGSAPGKIQEVFEPTPDEARFMGPPYNLSREKILAARPKA